MRPRAWILHGNVLHVLAWEETMESLEEAARAKSRAKTGKRLRSGRADVMAAEDLWLTPTKKRRFFLNGFPWLDLCS